MNKKHYVPAVFVLCLLLTGLALFFWLPKDTKLVEYVPENPTAVVLIDPGHGGYDPGTIGTDGTQEKDLALALAGRIGNRLHELRPDLEIRYTRLSDTVYWPAEESADLQARVNYSAEAGADYYLAIHFNAAENETANGLFGLVRPDDTFSQAICETIGESLAGIGFEALPAKTTDTQPVYVVDNQAIPSLLYECGFLSNPQELARLKNTRNLDALADAIAKAYASAIPQ